MQKQAMGNSTTIPPNLKSSPRMTKATSLREPVASSSLCGMQFASLSSSVDLSRQKRLTLGGLLDYLDQILKQVYSQDGIGFGCTLQAFLKERSGQLRGKVEQRLSLLKYLEGSLKYRSFGEVEAEAVREWRKNALLFLVGTIWARCMLVAEFKSETTFLAEYEKFRTLLANLTHFYFRSCLRVLAGKGVDSLSIMFDETAHLIVQGLSDWKEIYFKVLLPLIDPLPKVSCPQDDTQCKGCTLPCQFDLSKLRVNRHYLNPLLPENQLPQTTLLISEFAGEFRIHDKVGLLKRIRSTFLGEITETSKRIQAELGIPYVSHFEKDDIIDCMIYCIVRGGVTGLAGSLKALNLLLGRESEFLSKKGVDSYRADLQGAVQYLAEELSANTAENKTTVLASNCC